MTLRLCRDRRRAPSYVTRSGYTGEDGFEISSIRHARPMLRAKLLGHPEVKPIGLGARDSLRLEAGSASMATTSTRPRRRSRRCSTWSIGKRRREAADFPGAAHPRRSPSGSSASSGSACCVEGKAIRRAKARRSSISMARPRSASSPRAASRRPWGAPSPWASCERSQSRPAPGLTSWCAASSCRPKIVPMPFVQTRATTADRRSRWPRPSTPKDHEYIRVEGDVAPIGITQYAQEQLGDIVFVDVPKPPARTLPRAKRRGRGGRIGEGRFRDLRPGLRRPWWRVNDALADTPGLINSSSRRADGWIFKLKLDDKGELDGLMDADAYSRPDRLKSLG
jgi:glycine cleavage system H protein